MCLREPWGALIEAGHKFIDNRGHLPTVMWEKKRYVWIYLSKVAHTNRSMSSAQTKYAAGIDLPSYGEGMGKIFALVKADPWTYSPMEGQNDSSNALSKGAKKVCDFTDIPTKTRYRILLMEIYVLHSESQVPAVGRQVGIWQFPEASGVDRERLERCTYKTFFRVSSACTLPLHKGTPLFTRSTPLHKGTPLLRCGVPLHKGEQLSGSHYSSPFPTPLTQRLRN